MTFIPLPVIEWLEAPRHATTLLDRYTPYLLVDGSWLFLGHGDAVPAGAVRGTVADDGDGDVTLESGVVGGALMSTANSGGTLFLYAP